jgi:alcohol dehydrogenase class IV
LRRLLVKKEEAIGEDCLFLSFSLSLSLSLPASMVRFPPLAVFGGAFRKLPCMLPPGPPLLVTDRRLRAPIDAFVRAFPDARVFDGVVDEPTEEVVRSIQSAMRGASHVVALGGGSPIDAAKAANALRVGGGGGRGGTHLAATPPRLHLTAVPTTSGTGAEVTPFVVVKVGDEKRLASDPRLVPQLAVVDYELTRGMPPSLTASTGMDALCHAAEAYLSLRSTPRGDAHALEAMHGIGRSLLPACASPSPPDSAREGMSRASTSAGMAFTCSSVTLVHGMSRPLGRFGVPHGVANAQLVASVVRFTEGRASLPLLSRLAVVRDALFPNDRRPLSLCLSSLVRELGIPSLSHHLSSHHPSSSSSPLDSFLLCVPRMAEEAMRSGSPSNHPVPVSRADVERLYREVATADPLW